MATISLNDTGKALGEPVHIVLSDVDFPLADANATYETDSLAVIRNAKVHPLLNVEIPADTSADEQQAKLREEAAKSTDPFVNPQYDHLSAVALPEVVEAAKENNARIQAGEVPAFVPETPQTPVRQAPAPSFTPTPPSTDKTKGASD
jgi:hypothetical protein